MRKTFLFSATLVILPACFCGIVSAQSTPPKSAGLAHIRCPSWTDLGFCHEVDTRNEYSTAKYVGHDEPVVNFYSNVPGSGNSSIYLLTLPLDPPKPPVQDGGGTYNFQLHPAFWFGMNMCDTQSYPEYTDRCVPDTDDNIFHSADPNSPRFIGKHPGTAFMEMQFYPPGWVGSPQLIDPKNYFAAINIDSFQQNGASGGFNNTTCQNQVGAEPVNFAVITHNGVPLSPPNPLGANFGRNNFDVNNVLFMAPGDQILVILHDTDHGLLVILRDLTTERSGSMVGSAANGFGQVLFQPNSSTCNVAPYDFHPMYATSNLLTDTPWSIGTDNTTFSDEIGHFEFCDLADPNTGNCLIPGKEEGSAGSDADDTFCISPGESGFPGPPFIQVGACLQADLEYDGQSYGFNWPGTLADVHRDRKLHPQPIRFTSPVFFDTKGRLRNYDSVAFETDLPAFDPNCNGVTGVGCAMPAKGMPFYPFFTLGRSSSDDTCRWQFGGGMIPGTIDNYGGNPTSAWGSLFTSLLQTGPDSAAEFITNFRRALPHNPCRVDTNDMEYKVTRAHTAAP